MIISGPANEPPRHMGSTSNLTLKPEWQTQLFISKGLLLASAEHQQRLILDELHLYVCLICLGSSSLLQNINPSIFWWNSKNLLLFSHVFLHDVILLIYYVKTQKGVIIMTEILTVWILCVFHHARIFCWNKENKDQLWDDHKLYWLWKNSVREQRGLGTKIVISDRAWDWPLKMKSKVPEAHVKGQVPHEED